MTDTPENDRAHWDDAWRDRDPTSTSWFEVETPIGLGLVVGGGTPSSVVDIGAGQSTLVDHLLAAGVGHVTIVDIAAEPLDVTTARLRADGADLAAVDAVVTDVRAWEPARTYDCWHDRAAFHFLGDPDDQAAYATVAAGAVEPGGRLIVGTFATDGPEVCSGLPVTRRDPTSLAAVFAEAFDLDRCVDHTHVTPWGAEQHFLHAVFLRR